MTTYTADDFKNARFATRPNPDGDGSSIAMRSELYREPWETPINSFHDSAMARDGWVPVQEARTLTVDDITDEMADRFIAAYMAESGPLPGAIRAGLVAMHASPPSRPEWADLADKIDDAMTGPGGIDGDTLAERLHAEGVRVTGEPNE